MNRFLAAVLAVALAFAGASLVSDTARADTPTTRAPSPGANYRWGLPLSALSSQTNIPTTTAVQQAGGKFGGFLNGNVVNGSGMASCQVVDPPQYYVNTTVWPSTARFGEPMILSGGLVIPYTKTNLPGDLRPNNAYPYLSVDGSKRSGMCDRTPVPIATGLWCQATEWAQNPAPTWRPVYGVAGQFNPDNQVVGFGQPDSWLTSNCPYISQIDFWACTVPYAATNYTCREMTWLAENAFQRTPYPVQDDTKVGCQTPQGAQISNSCVYALGVADPLDVSQVCVGLQVPAWLDFSWILPDIGIYARCLFQPASGFDRLHAVSDAWAAGPLVAATSGVTAAVSSFAITASCGVLIPKASTGLLRDFTMNTCDWPPALSTLKQFIVVASLGLFGWWVYQFITSVIAGIVSRRTPDLIEADK